MFQKSNPGQEKSHSVGGSIDTHVAVLKTCNFFENPFHRFSIALLDPNLTFFAQPVLQTINTLEIKNNSSGFIQREGYYIPSPHGSCGP